MAKVARTSCDFSDDDITYTGTQPGCRLRLTAEVLVRTTRGANAVLRRPSIENDTYFCDLSRLRDWLNEVADA